MNILTETERGFIAEFLKDGDFSRAAKLVGYLGKSPTEAGRKIAMRPHVAWEIARQYKALLDKLSFGAEEFHQRLIEEIDADIADLFDDDGQLKPVSAWPKAWRRGLVTGIDVEERQDGYVRVLKVKLDNRNARLQMLGKHRSVAAFAAERVEVAHSDLDKLFDSLEPTVGPPSERQQSDTDEDIKETD